MKTIQEIIDRTDGMKINAIDVQCKLGWIAELDGRIATEVMLMSSQDAAAFAYPYPEGLQCVPLVDFPYDSIYELYLAAMIDFTNGEYSKYQNTMELFNAKFDAFVCWFASTYEPAQGYRKEGG